MSRHLVEGSVTWRATPRKPARKARPTGHRPRVLSVTFDAVLLEALTADPAEPFDCNFYKSDRWPTRGNSTFRLDIVNYLALARIDNHVDIEWVCDRDLPREVLDFFNSYDVVVIHQIRTPRAVSSLRRILAQLMTGRPEAQIIFGTELSWYNELRNGALTREELRYVFTKCTVLRHTAKTEMAAYRTHTFDDIRVQEFEIGIDTDVVRNRRPWMRRHGVLFVPAPAGRVTKNNDAIDRVRDALGASPVLRRLPVAVLKPPYSSADYWRLASRARYVVSTSRGETFSYVVNDAKACGAIAFFPASMFANDARPFVLDSYPDQGVRYGSVADLVSKLENFERSASLRRRASRAARREVVSRFSVDVIADNWRRVLLGEALNDESAVLVDLRRGNASLQTALQQCRRSGAKYLVSFRNGGFDPFEWPGFSWRDPGSDAVVIKHWAHERDGRPYPIRGVGGFGVAALDGSEEVPEPRLVELQYWRLFVRLYKVSTLWVDSRLGQEMGDLLAGIRVFDGVDRRLRALDVARLP